MVYVNMGTTSMLGLGWFGKRCQILVIMVWAWIIRVRYCTDVGRYIFDRNGEYVLFMNCEHWLMRMGLVGILKFSDNAFGLNGEYGLGRDAGD